MDVGGIKADCEVEILAEIIVDMTVAPEYFKRKASFPVGCDCSQ